MTRLSSIRKKRFWTHHRSIAEAFFDEFEDTFMKQRPSWKEVKLALDWLKNEAKYARNFTDIEAVNECRRKTEAHFSRFVHFRKKVLKESQNVNCKLKRASEELRIIRRNTLRKFYVFEARHEEEKAPVER